mmetsp:Transcript_26309/g.63368  ORF Transcript_26309/g.63368 Transcript_26309/m.63368 type:complete len:212 (-) Transcript_26309:224-859(-)
MYVGLVLRRVPGPVAAPHACAELGKQKPLHRHFAAREDVLNYLAAWPSGCRSDGGLDDTWQLFSHVENLVHGSRKHGHPASVAILPQKICDKLVDLLADRVLRIAQELEEVVVRRVVKLASLGPAWVGLLPLEVGAGGLGPSTHPVVIQLPQLGLHLLNERQSHRSARTADAHGLVPVWRDIYCARDGRGFATVRWGLVVPRGPQSKAAKD